MQIHKLKDLTLEAKKELFKIQNGEKKIVKTGFECIDVHINGLLSGDIAVFSSISGHGKSTLLLELKDNILDTNLNPEADDYVFLDISLEMKIFNILVRSIHKILNKSKKDILFKNFTEEEKEICKKYFERMEDGRQFISQTPATPEELYKGVREFLIEHKDKKAVFVAIDHILLLSGADKKGVIDNTVEYLNQLKLEFSNCYFFIFSQLNRTVLSRIAEKNNLAAPTSADLYGSEFMQQAASYSIIIFNAYKLGINQFMKVNKEFYSYLSDHFGEEDDRGKVSFNTMGKLFHIVTKVREGDAVFRDLFIIDMKMDEETKQKLTLPQYTPAQIKPPTFKQDEFSFTDREQKNEIIDF